MSNRIPDAEPWWSRVGTTILDKPGGLAIIFSLVLLGMLLGIIPSTLSTKMENIEAGMTKMHEEHVAISSKIDTAVTTASANGNLQTQLLRGICIIMAKTQTEQLNYCNP